MGYNHVKCRKQLLYEKCSNSMIFVIILPCAELKATYLGLLKAGFLLLKLLI